MTERKHDGGTIGDLMSTVERVFQADTNGEKSSSAIRAAAAASSTRAALDEDKGTVLAVEPKKLGSKTILTTTVRYASQAVRDSVIKSGMTTGVEQSFDRLESTILLARRPA